nr:MAG TPA: Major capsid protein [Caudoviricetes sp.]
MPKLKMNLQMFGAQTPVDPTTTNTHVSENFGKLLYPGLRKIFFETYDEIPEQFPKIFNVQTSTSATETDHGMGAFGDWEERTSEVSTVAYAKISDGGDVTYKHKAFTKGFMIGRELYDDEKYGQMKKMSKALARAGRAKVERDAITVLTKGFKGESGAFKGRDGKELFHDQHTLVDCSSKTCSNLMEGALSRETLKEGLKLMRTQLDEAGNLIQMKATKLIIPPALEDEARRILHSTQVSGTELNDTNEYLKSAGLEIVVLDYLGEEAGGSDTMWFLQDGSRHELNFFWRVRPEFKNEEDFDTFVAKYRGYMRYSYGFSDWRGMVGSKGEGEMSRKAKK